MARSIEVQEHPTTQRRIKVAQRLGVALLLLYLLAALVGAFGVSGPMAEMRARHSGLEVTYPRFARRLSPTGIDVRVQRAAGDTVTLTLQGELARAFVAETILPRPDQVTSAGDAHVYRFAAVPGQPHQVRFDGQMEAIGPVAGTVRVDDGAPVTIDTFVYP